MPKSNIDLWLLWIYTHMQKIKLISRTYFDLLEFQESWILIGRDKKLGMLEYA